MTSDLLLEMDAPFYETTETHHVYLLIFTKATHYLHPHIRFFLAESRKPKDTTTVLELRTKNRIWMRGFESTDIAIVFAQKIVLFAHDDDRRLIFEALTPEFFLDAGGIERGHELEKTRARTPEKIF